MKDQYALGGTAILLLGGLMGLATATAESVYAQGGGRSTPVARRIERANRDSEAYERDSLNRELKGISNKPSDRRKAQAAAAQVKQDLENLQLHYNQIVLALGSRQKVNQDSVITAVAEVNRCATRLKANLALPRPATDEDQEEKSSEADKQIEQPLVTLLKRVYSFVTNPLFETPAVLNVKDVGKARRDLDTIIELSESIGKTGVKLTTPTKP